MSLIRLFSVSVSAFLAHDMQACGAPDFAVAVAWLVGLGLWLMPEEPGVAGEDAEKH